MRFRTRLARLTLFAALLAAAAAFAQQPALQESGKTPVERATPNRRLPDYVLGPNDEIVILSVDVEEIAKTPTRVTTAGDINLPLVGRIHVAGMTVQQLEAELIERLKVFYKQPEVAVNVTQLKSQPVSVIGSVGSPGLIQLEGRKTLIEVLSLAGGTQTDASAKIRITRFKEWGPIPLPLVISDPNADFSVAEVNIRSIMDASHPEQNIQIMPFDVITVPRAEIVYVLGDVKAPGGYALKEKETISVIQLLALASGTNPTASKKNGKIIRPVPGGERIELPVDVDALLKGKAKDVTLKPEDILYIPDSYSKGAFRRTLDSIIGATTGMAIYRIP